MSKGWGALYLIALIMLAPAAQAFDCARADEERMLGRADEAQATAALMLYRRQFSVEGIVTGSLTDSTSLAGVPPAAMLEALRALESVLDLEQDLRTGDRFAARWEQEFTLDNHPVGVGRLLAVELHTARNGTIAISRFRPMKGDERFYLADGRLAAPPPVSLPLDRIQITSGFGLRPDPLDQPQRVPPVVAPPTARGPAPLPAERVVEDRKEIVHAYAGFINVGQLGNASDVRGRNADLDRIMAERRVQRREEAARKQAEKEAAEKAVAARDARPQPPPQTQKPVLLYMHEGLDLLANIGTPIHAAADGLVTLARPDRGYGNAIHVEHAGRLTTIYGHLSRFAPGITAGAWVGRGQLIGFVGNTGRSTGAHLHFEVLVSGHPVNPTSLTQLPRLTGFDLARFRKQLAFELRERAIELADACDQPSGAGEAVASLVAN